MLDDVIIRIRTALERGGIAAAELELLKLEGVAKEASAAGNALGIDYEKAGRRIASAAVIGAGALTLFLKKGIDLAAGLNIVSERIGVSVEDLSRLKFAAEQSGTNFETLTRGLQFFSRRLAQAGVDGSQLVPVFLDLADKIQSTTSTAEKQAIAFQNLGRSAGSELVPFLNKGREGFEEINNSVGNLVEVTTEAARAADKFNNLLGTLAASSAALAAEIAGPLVTSVNAFLEALVRSKAIEDAKDRNEAFRDSAKEITDEIQKIDDQLAGGVPAKQGIIARRAELEKLKAELIATNRAALGIDQSGFVGPPRPPQRDLNRVLDLSPATEAQKAAAQEAKQAEKEAAQAAKQAASEKAAASREAASAAKQAADEEAAAAQKQQQAVDQISQSLREQIDATNAERDALATGGAEGARYATIQSEIAKATAANVPVTAALIAQVSELADSPGRPTRRRVLCIYTGTDCRRSATERCLQRGRSRSQALRSHPARDI